VSTARRRRVALLAGALALVTAGLLFVAAVGNRRLSYLTRDPQASTFERWFLGFFSNVGNALWWAAAGAALLAACVLLAARADGGGGEPGRFLLGVAAVTALLAIDDMFGIHDQWAREEGLPKPLFFVAYATAAGVVFWRFRAEVVRTWLLPLVLSIGLYFASSVFDELFGTSRSDLRFLAEDGVKLLSIVCWAAWVGHSAFTRLRAGAGDRGPRALSYD
jgi:hypothetical protein